MQYTEIFFRNKHWKFHWKNVNIHNIIAQDIDCGYTLEQPHLGGSNEYPQSVFWIKNKKNKVFCLLEALFFPNVRKKECF